MKIDKIKTEHVIYCLLFVLALFLRLFNLGDIPLNQPEASLAYRAFDISRGLGVDVAGQPAYVLLTGLLFMVFGSSDLLARLLPAIAGSTLVWLPYFYRHRLGRVAAILAAFGLALDPGLVSISRQAGSPMLALTFTLFSITAWMSGAPVWAGALGGLSLLSGPSAVFGWVVFGLTMALLTLLTGKKYQIAQKDQRTALWAGLIVLILVGTGFMRYPGGITGVGQAVIAFIQGFGRLNGVSIMQVPLALLVYQPLPLLFAVIAFLLPLDAHGSSILKIEYYLLTAIGLLLLYPSRQIDGLIWAVVPLWGLAGMALAHLLPENEKQTNSVMWSQAAVTIILFALFWIQISAITSVTHGDLRQAVQLLFTFNFDQFNLLDLNTKNYIMRMAVLFLVPFLLILTTLMMGMGWSFREAKRGLIIGGVCSLLLYTFSVSRAAGQNRDAQVNELWRMGVAAGTADQMLSIVGDLSEWNTGQRQEIDVVYLVDSDWLHWYLRHFPQARYKGQLNTGELPSVVITTLDDQPASLMRAYRGQSFSLSQYPLWNTIPPNFPSWLVFREAPFASEQAIIWARLDLFPGDVNFSDGQSTFSFNELP